MDKNSKWLVYIFIVVILAAIFGIFQFYEDQSKQMSNVTPGEHWINVSYANASSAEKMDIYLPNTKGPYPVIIWIHGGGYLSGDKSTSDSSAAREGLKRGYAVVSINYRLADEARFPAQIYDVKAAIRYLRANAQTYNLNPDKFAVWGSSAGGGLAALAGTSGDVKDLQNDSLGYGNVSNKVQAVVDQKGPINFGTLLPQLQKIESQKSSNYTTAEIMLTKELGANVTLIPEQVAKANPETYITPDDPPFFIEHGTADTLIPYQQSVDFVNKLKSILGSSKVTFVSVQGSDHSDHFATQSNINMILDFLDRYLKQ